MNQIEHLTDFLCITPMFQVKELYDYSVQFLKNSCFRDISPM